MIRTALRGVFGYMSILLTADIAQMINYRSYKKRYKGQPHPPSWESYLREQKAVNYSPDEHGFYSMKDRWGKN